MILDVSSRAHIENAILRIEANLEALKSSNFCFKEKQDLRKIYNNQLDKYKQKRMSFSKAV